MDTPDKHTILLVEDDSTLRRMLTVALQTAGYQVCDVANGQAAQELFNSESPDLLLTDLQMPVMDGLQLVAWVRQDARSDIPILVLTSLGHKQAGEQALAAGANAVETKPLALARLLAEIRKLLSA